MTSPQDTSSNPLQRKLRHAIILGVALASLSFLSLYFGVRAEYQNNDLRKALAAVQLQLNDGAYLTRHADTLNSYVDTRINHFVSEQKKKVIAKYYDGFALAPSKTESGKHIYGDEKARFSLVEFTDFECPYCKQYHNTPKKVVDSSKGLVNWEVLHRPLPMHDPVASMEAIAAECIAKIAGNQTFFVYSSVLFQETHSNGQGAGDLAQLADNIGVDKQAFQQCLTDDKSVRSTLQANIQKADGLGVNSTPVTFIVDNQAGTHVMLSGVVDPNQIASAVQRLAKGGSSSNE